MNNVLNYILIQLSFTFEFAGFVIDNKSCGSSFIKGGIAREYAMLHFGVIENLTIRDMDLWLDPEDNDSLLCYLCTNNYADYDCNWHSIETLLENTDVDINQCLLGKDGLYIHKDAIKAFKGKRIKVTEKRKIDKASLRAHLFALRYGFETEAYLPDESFYYHEVTALKAAQLGLLWEWKDYLWERGVDDYYLQDIVFDMVIGRHKVQEQGLLEHYMWDEEILPHLEVEEYPSLSFMKEWVDDSTCWWDTGQILYLFNFTKGEYLTLFGEANKLTCLLTGETLPLKEC